MAKEFIVYKITNKINNKLYVGLTINGIKRRMNDHIGAAKKGNSGHLYNSIRKYGKNSFKIEEIDKAYSQKELEQKEIYWIDRLDTFKNGMNMTIGGEGATGHKHTKEAKRKISIASKNMFNNGNGHDIGKYWIGRKQSKEHIEKIRKANTGQKRTEESKRKMSIAHKGVKLSKEHIRSVAKSKIGFKHTEKSKKKMSIAQMGHKVSKETRKKQSLAHIGNKNSEETRRKISIANTGSKRTKEQRKNISKGQIGKIVSQKTREKISKTLMGHKINLGKHHSKETKDKLRNYFQKLSSNQVFKIRELLKTDITQTKIAELFNVSGSVISGIKNNKSYTNF